jgi:hypothetical protein
MSIISLKQYSSPKQHVKPFIISRKSTLLTYIYILFIIISLIYYYYYSNIRHASASLTVNSEGVMNTSSDYDYLYRFNEKGIRSKDEIFNQLPAISRFGINCFEKDVEKILNLKTENLVKIHYAKYNGQEFSTYQKFINFISSQTIDKTSLTETYIRNTIRNGNCVDFLNRRGYYSEPVSSVEAEFPISFSIIIYNKIGQFERLLRTIYRPQNYYCIHVDAKSDESFFNTVKELTECFPNVFLTRRVKVYYAGYSRLQADFNCMDDLLENFSDWKYLINMAGTEFPVRTNLELVKYLKEKIIKM